MSRRTVVSGTMLGLYCFGLGFACGVIKERVDYDVKRSALLAELDAAASRVRARLMLLEKDALHSDVRDTQ